MLVCDAAHSHFAATKPQAGRVGSLRNQPKNVNVELLHGRSILALPPGSGASFQLAIVSPSLWLGGELICHNRFRQPGRLAALTQAGGSRHYFAVAVPR